MSDPLSYTDAIISAFAELAKRSIAFALVCIGAAFLGLNIHHAPMAVATYGPAGFADLSAFAKCAEVLFLNWLPLIAHNVGVMWISPWTIFYLGYFAFFCWAEETFRWLLVLAVVHSVHAFLFMQEAIPLSGTALGASLALLIISEVATVALLLWWKYVRENTPLPMGYGAPRILAGGK